jgi:glutathionylspermidine synthase
VERLVCEPRRDWQDQVARVGFPIHSGSAPYWDETACYRLTPSEVDALSRATNEIQARTLDAVQHVIDRRRYAELCIPDLAIPLIEASWNANRGDGDPALYGRLDLAFDGSGPPKLLEYNADTPTALIEAAVVQWDWVLQAQPGADQFNAIHERLIAAWKDLRPYFAMDLYFTCLDQPEDVLTTSYLQDTAAQAGLKTVFVEMNRIGWTGREFVDDSGLLIRSIFKLYPWEWMVREEFGPHLAAASARWIEPPWKMLVSNKGFLAILWELFPGHPNLLATHREPHGSSYAKKPLLSREGADVTLVHDGAVVAQGPDGAYGAEGFVYQELVQPTPRFGGKLPVIGSWLIQGESAGIGIREADDRITTNASRFVPHFI